MASLRKKYQPQFGNPSKDDGPPVRTPPAVTAAELPPPVAADAPKPPELETESPAEKAAQSELRKRLSEMERAEALSRPQPQQPRHAEPQEPLTAEQIIAGAAIPDEAKDWLRQRPEYVLDPVKNGHLQKAHDLAEAQTGEKFSARYFERMESLLGFATNGHAESKPTAQQANYARPHNSALPRQPARPMSGPPVSAPPHREPPSMATGRAPTYRQPLTEDELFIAQQSGMTPAQYQEKKALWQKMKAEGAQ